MGRTANRFPTVCVPAEPSTKEKGVPEGSVRVHRVVDAELVGDAEHREPVAELVDRAQALHLDDLDVGHSNVSNRCAMSARTARSLSGRRGAPGGVVSESIRPRSCRNSAASCR